MVEWLDAGLGALNTALTPSATAYRSGAEAGFGPDWAPGLAGFLVATESAGLAALLLVAASAAEAADAGPDWTPGLAGFLVATASAADAGAEDAVDYALTAGAIATPTSRACNANAVDAERSFIMGISWSAAVATLTL
jgi:hypothetical protein